MQTKQRAIHRAGMGSFQCLILEEDEHAVRNLTLAIGLEGGQATVSKTIEEAVTAVSNQLFDVLILDNRLFNGKAENFFALLPKGGACVPRTILTGPSLNSTCQSLVRDKFCDFLSKPVEMEAARQCIRLAVSRSDGARANKDFSGFVIESASMREIRLLATQAADNPKTTVLLTGESGSGKDVVANLIHTLTFKKVRPQPPFVSINCSALPGEMFESELFGARKGAFTGAVQDRIGLGGAAGAGTLFLDEVAEIQMSLQAKLLQFLETGTYRQLGSTTPQQFKGRVIAATNKLLDQEVRAGRFRSDLFFRLDVLSIHIPPFARKKGGYT